MQNTKPVSFSFSVLYIFSCKVKYEVQNFTLLLDTVIVQKRESEFKIEA